MAAMLCGALRAVFNLHVAYSGSRADHYFASGDDRLTAALIVGEKDRRGLYRGPQRT